MKLNKLYEIQKRNIPLIQNTLQKNGAISINLPTGSGKTILTLLPAIQSKKKILYTAPNHAALASPIRDIKYLQKIDLIPKDITALCILGKKHLCPNKSVNILNQEDFFAECKNLRESDGCPFYLNTIDKDEGSTKGINHLTPLGQELSKKLPLKTPTEIKNIINQQEFQALCPKAVIDKLIEKHSIIIGDLYYACLPNARKLIDKSWEGLNNSILILDEVHILPNRLRDIDQRTLWLDEIGIIKEELQNELFNTINRSGFYAFLDLLTNCEQSLPFIDFLGKKYNKVETFKRLLEKLKINFDDCNGILDKIDENIKMFKQGTTGKIRKFINMCITTLLSEDFEYIFYIKKNKTNRIGLVMDNLCPLKRLNNLHKHFDSIISLSATFPKGALATQAPELMKKMEIVEEVNKLTENEKVFVFTPEYAKFSNYPKSNPWRYRNIKEKIEDIKKIIKHLNGRTIIFCITYEYVQLIRDFLHKHTIENTKLLFSPKVKDINQTETEKYESQEEKYFEREMIKYKNVAYFTSIWGKLAKAIELPSTKTQQGIENIIIVGFPHWKRNVYNKAQVEKYQSSDQLNSEMVGTVMQALGRAKRDKGRDIQTQIGNYYLYDTCFTKNSFVKHFPKTFKNAILNKENQFTSVDEWIKRRINT